MAAGTGFLTLTVDGAIINELLSKLTGLAVICNQY
jgi:hypothetical protein